MAFVGIDDAVAFAIDAAIKSSDMRQLDQNVDYLKARLVTGTGHTHNQAGTDEGGPVTPADGSVTTAKLADANVTLAKLKTAQGSFSFTSPWSENVYISMGNDYAHMPKITGGNNTVPVDLSLTWSGTMPAGQYFNLSGNGVDGPVSVTWQYHSN